MRRLVDEFVSRAEQLGFGVVAGEVIAFADVLWSPIPRLEELQDDPGVIVQSAERCIVFQRVHQVIRYYAGPKSQTITGGHQLGMINNVDDAMELAKAYLSGSELHEIPVTRVVLGEPEPDTSNL